jgi:hypothetical protein
MRLVSIATLLAACATFAYASPLVRRAVYAGELVSPKADDTIAIDQQFQLAYLPAVRSLLLFVGEEISFAAHARSHSPADSRNADQVPTGPHIGNPPRFESLSVGLQGPAPVGRVNGDFTSVAILELADDLDRADDDGPWVNGTLTIPSQAVTETGTYCESRFARRSNVLLAAV